MVLCVVYFITLEPLKSVNLLIELMEETLDNMNAAGAIKDSWLIQDVVGFVFIINLQKINVKWKNKC